MTGRLPKIALLSLGGTIASRVDARGHGASLELDAADLLAALPVLGDIAEIVPQRFRLLASSNLVMADIVELVGEIDRLARTGIDGAVVTQGTDTIEETAYLLDLLLPPGVPVVVTGAMRNAGKPGEDGPANLVAAVRVAASPEARDTGVLVVLDDTVHLARFVRKSHTSATGTFVSTRVGPVGYLVEDRIRLPLRPRQLSPHFVLPPGTTLPDVALATLSLGSSERLLSAVAGAGYQGLVIEAFGAGHVPERLVPVLNALAQELPVVFSSRTGAGELFRGTGTYPGSEGDLIARGLISAVGLDGPKARILLTLLLATGTARSEIAAAFEAAEPLDFPKGITCKSKSAGRSPRRIANTPRPADGTASLWCT